MGIKGKKAEDEVERGQIQPGAIDDIYELRFQYEMAKTGSITGIENKINTAGTRSSRLGK